MNKQRAFILSIKDAAIKSCTGQKLFPSVVIAQACLESNYGASGLSVDCKNFFGVKVSSKWTGPYKEYKTKEYIKTQGKTITVLAKFCKYESFEQSLAEHNAMIKRVPTYEYHGVFRATSPEGQANALRLAGYATDPAYPKKLTDIINQFQLKQYDTDGQGHQYAFMKGEEK